MKKTLFFFAMIVTVLAFGQDSTAVGKATAGQVIGLIVPIIVAIYELVVRLAPTTANWSILSLIMKIIQGLIPNKNTTGGTHD